MSYSIALILLNTIISVTTDPHFFDQNKQIHRDLFLGDGCTIVHSDGVVNGICLSIVKCPTVLTNVKNKWYNHTVCGYDGSVPNVCCPNDTKQVKNLKKLNLLNNLNCTVVNTKAAGVIKFLSECRELNQHFDNGTSHTNLLCSEEICSDLVCCPVVRHKTRIKPVCWNVDHPADTLELRLMLNKECTVNELNITGILQRKCAYVDRHPHLATLLKGQCNDDLCDSWYCCPIEQNDIVYCTPYTISPSIAILAGPKCIDSKSGRTGTCKNNCGDGKYLQKDGTLSLDKCGQYCCSNYYCCPDEDENNDELVNSSISVQSCRTYTNYLQKEIIGIKWDSLENCSWALASPAGGIEAIPGEFPHMAALGYKLDHQIFWKCGGSLISDQYLLTAAHCIINKIGPVKKVRLGAINLLNDGATRDCPEEYDVIKQIAHPMYSPLLAYNDIGLIQIDGIVKFNFNIRPICLPSSPDIPESFTSMGWGATGPVEDQTVKLLKVDQILYSYEECSEFYEINFGRKIKKGIFNETQICAGSRNSIQSTCDGDSGGPLLNEHPTNRRLFEIFGIVSFGVTCGFPNSPGIYTKVFPFVKWIEKTVWGT